MIDAVAGLTAMAVSTAPVTVSVAVPETLPEAALIVVVPAPTPLARPAAEIVATTGLLLVHATLALQSAVVLSEYVHVAVNCDVAPTRVEAVPGETAMLDKVRLPEHTSAGQGFPSDSQTYEVRVIGPP